ncbi:hypothetical protein GOODEAATRI_005560 [Goodea atripinnis]|uniref:Uncharacterized protein n=1 Tax=Goodea atripinnis TaxID=208336 RepID=A0ABV0MYZ3_9TELE
MKGNSKTTTETWKTWICLMRRQALVMHKVNGNDDEPSTAVSKTKPDAASKPANTPTKPSKPSPSAVTTATPVTPTSAKATTAPTTPLGVNLAKVDLGKISSILSSLTSAMKNTGGFWAALGILF